MNLCNITDGCLQQKKNWFYMMYANNCSAQVEVQTFFWVICISAFSDFQLIPENSSIFWNIQIFCISEFHKLNSYSYFSSYIRLACREFEKC